MALSRILFFAFVFVFSACTVAPTSDQAFIPRSKEAFSSNALSGNFVEMGYRVNGVVLIADVRFASSDLIHYTMEVFLDDGRVFTLYFGSKIPFMVGDRVEVLYKNRKIYSVKKIF